MSSTVKFIISRIKNNVLASALYKSISIGLATPNVRLLNKTSVKDVFTNSLNLAFRDIETHPRGHLFKRLIEFGPLNPDENDISLHRKGTFLSDEECILAVNFIFSFIINRFKGELAELLSIQPCLDLLKILINRKRVTSNTFICFGDIIKQYQKRRVKKVTLISSGTLAKGADGLIIENRTNSQMLNLKGIIEIKSMYVYPQRILSQINKHLARLQWGLVLANKKYSPRQLNIDRKNILKIMITPSSWKVNREYKWEEHDDVKKMIFPELDSPKEETTIEEITTNTWKIKLNWSQEALEQAAYEMTFWYMSQVGKSVYNKQTLPSTWVGMSAEEAGFNSIKEKLYYILLRPLTKYQGKKAIKLYNVYSFGYPLGIDSKEMLWLEDVRAKQKH